ncbi:MAG: serine/threonine protein kinase [Azoarcus sp.]|jgi:serine/threonine protein kinase|nr:serine/threonine protein kinase [Azoarcus sp.]
MIRESFGLPAGTRLQEFEVLSVLGGGAVSLVYKAYDRDLHRHAALKEYLPTALARRGGQRQLEIAAGKQDLFEQGLRRFIAEAHIMTRFDHPVLRKAWRLFRENGTAYFAMPYYEGITLRKKVHDDYRAKSLGELLTIILPVLEGLSLLHRAGYCHFGISPDDILIQSGDAPVLLDFGAARRPGENQEDRAVTELSPGFAAPEQYESDSARLGAWSDIYSLAAVIYYIVSGIVPDVAISRLSHDSLRPLASFATPELPASLLTVIDRGLTVAPQARLQSIAEFVRSLDAALSGLAYPGADVIMRADATVSAFSPAIKKILRSAWALRDQSDAGQSES